MIYRYFNEKVNYFKSMNHIDSDKHSSYKVSYASGNAFESLAQSNPEYIDMQMLENLKNSKNLIEDFRNFFCDPSNGSIDYSFNKRGYNVSIYDAFFYELNKLVDYEGLDYSYAMDLIFSNYIPDSMSEKGIQKLIDLRIKKNNMFISSLQSMLEHNYDELNLSIKKAKLLENQLSDNLSRPDAIIKIKDIIRNQKILERFRVKDNCYDFSSIGGGLFITAENVKEAKSHDISKYLTKIFEYDAIIIAHGDHVINSTYVYNFDHHKKKLIFKIFLQIEELIELCKKRKISQNFLEDLEAIKELVVETRRTIESGDKDFINSSIKLTKMIHDTAYNYKNILKSNKPLNILYTGLLENRRRLINLRYALNNKTKVREVGDFVEWFLSQPIATPDGRYHSRVFDVLEWLRDNGYKNVLLYCCNPGGLKPPKYMVDDKDFIINMGLYNVMMESTVESLQERFKISDIGTLLRKSVAEFKSFCNTIKNNIKKILDSVDNSIFKKHTIKLNIIKINKNGNPYISQESFDSKREMNRIITESNNAIMDLMHTTSNMHDTMVNAANTAHASMVDQSIFDTVQFML